MPPISSKRSAKPTQVRTRPLGPVPSRCFLVSFHAVLSNKQRREQYDMFGNCEEFDFSEFEDLLSGGFDAMMEDFDEFLDFLAVSPHPPLSC